MRTRDRAKSFDVMKWLRETRDRIYETTKHMTPEGRRRGLDEMVRSDPLFSRLPTSSVVMPRRAPATTGSRDQRGECMSAKGDDMSFDVMTWLRETRDRLYEETKGITPEEGLRWSKRPSNRPLPLAAFFDRIPKSRKPEIASEGNAS